MCIYIYRYIYASLSLSLFLSLYVGGLSLDVVIVAGFLIFCDTLSSIYLSLSIYIYLLLRIGCYTDSGFVTRS